eukprot:PhM_4_TR9327/c0_g1_i1/m.20854
MYSADLFHELLDLQYLAEDGDELMETKDDGDASASTSKKEEAALLSASYVLSSPYVFNANQNGESKCEPAEQHTSLAATTVVTTPPPKRVKIESSNPTTQENDDVCCSSLHEPSKIWPLVLSRHSDPMLLTVPEEESVEEENISSHQSEVDLLAELIARQRQSRRVLEQLQWKRRFDNVSAVHKHHRYPKEQKSATMVTTTKTRSKRGTYQRMTPVQLDALTDLFTKHDGVVPVQAIRDVAAALDLPEHKVRQWLANQRAKIRRVDG